MLVSAHSGAKTVLVSFGSLVLSRSYRFPLGISATSEFRGHPTSRVFCALQPLACPGALGGVSTKFQQWDRSPESAMDAQDGHASIFQFLRLHVAGASALNDADIKVQLRAT